MQVADLPVVLETTADRLPAGSITTSQALASFSQAFSLRCIRLTLYCNIEIPSQIEQARAVGAVYVFASLELATLHSYRVLFQPDKSNLIWVDFLKTNGLVLSLLSACEPCA